MKKTDGEKYILKCLKQQCEADSNSFNNQRKLYFEAMCNSQERLLSIVEESESKTVSEQINEIKNLDAKKQAVDDALSGIKKILEYNVEG